MIIKVKISKIIIGLLIIIINESLTIYPSLSNIIFSKLITALAIGLIMVALFKKC